jgi:hypothetical protein
MLEKQYNNFENGLLYGKAGLALYYARLSSMDKSYNTTYNKIINDLLSKIDNNTAVEFSRGLLGIGLAVDFILKFYKDGNPDYVLEDIDAIIYRSLDMNDHKKNIDVDIAAEGLLYIVLHIKYGIKGKTKKEIFVKKAISLLEHVYAEKQNNFFHESVPSQLFTKEFFLLYSIASLFEQGYYTDRIVHICNELIYELSSSTPILQFNRLVRAFLVSKIVSTIKGISTLWNEFAELQIRQISIDQLINNECKNMQLNLSDGLTGVYLLMEQINKCYPYPIFNISWDYYYKKVQNSLIKERIQKDDIQLYDMGINGFWGVNYCVDTRCNNIEDLF